MNISELKYKLDCLAMVDEFNNEVWSARTLMDLFGYVQWRQFRGAIDRAYFAIQNSPYRDNANYHIRYVNDICNPEFDRYYNNNMLAGTRKHVTVNNGAVRENHIEDFIVSKLGAQFIAINGDPRKEEIAFIQAYFITMSNALDEILDNMEYVQRAACRENYTINDKSLSSAIIQSNGTSRDIGMIKSHGDVAFYGMPTKTVKQMHNIPQNKPLADYEPSVNLSARAFAMELTSAEAKQKHYSIDEIDASHIINNDDVRNVMVKKGIYPEDQEFKQDFKKIERSTKKDAISSLKDYDSRFKNLKLIDPFIDILECEDE